MSSQTKSSLSSSSAVTPGTYRIILGKSITDPQNILSFPFISMTFSNLPSNAEFKGQITRTEENNFTCIQPIRGSKHKSAAKSNGFASAPKTNSQYFLLFNEEEGTATIERITATLGLQYKENVPMEEIKVDLEAEGSISDLELERDIEEDHMG